MLDSDDNGKVFATAIDDPGRSICVRIAALVFSYCRK